MATIQELKRQIEKANELGIENLADKGVGFVGITPTTYDIMQGIADILTDGGGVSLDHTVTFVADGKPYEIVRVTDGNSVDAPSGIPTNENGDIYVWKANGESVHFPYTPTSDVEINASFGECVECIESTGTQYIDTGIIPDNHRLKIKFQCATNDNGCLFGSYGDKSNHSNYNVYELVWYSGKWYYAPDSSNGTQSSLSPTFYPTDIIELDFNTYDKKIIMNGTSVDDTYGVSKAVLPLYLFRQSGAEAVSKIKLWYAQIYDRATQTLVRDFVPAKDEKGVACLYDKVTKAYFYNQGSGEFIVA